LDRSVAPWKLQYPIITGLLPHTSLAEESLRKRASDYYTPALESFHTLGKVQR